MVEVDGQSHKGQVVKMSPSQLMLLSFNALDASGSAKTNECILVLSSLIVLTCRCWAQQADERPAMREVLLELDACKKQIA